MSEPKPNQLGFQTNDEVLTSVYNQIKISENNPERDTAKMSELRSKIYVRDRGVCWICNEFVEMDEYHLGHLVDHCVGGWEDYDNLAVMHASCNLSKPHHYTLEDAMRWKLTLGLPIKRLIQHTTLPPIPVNRPTILPELTSPPKAEIPELNRNDIVVNMQNNTKYVYQRKKYKPNQVEQPKSILGRIINLFHNNTQLDDSYEPLSNPSDKPMNEKQQIKYKEQCAKIKPCTLCWVQGYPQGGAMWRVFPPPYTKEVSFCMRRTPPGAKAPNKGKGAIDTIQVINGNLKEPMDVDMGIYKIHIEPCGSSIATSFVITDKANNSKYGKTIGWGQNQIPIEAWDKAKAEGISLSEFRDSYKMPD